MEQKLQMISISDNSLFSIVYHTEYKREKGKHRKGWLCEKKGRVPHLVVVFRLAPVTDKVETTDDLANSEETDDLSGGDTGEGHLLGAGVADAGQEVLGGGQVLDSGGVLGGVDQGLEVGLEGGNVAKEKEERELDGIWQM